MFMCCGELCRYHWEFVHNYIQIHNNIVNTQLDPHLIKLDPYCQQPRYNQLSNIAARFT